MAFTNYQNTGFDTINNALSNLGKTWNDAQKQQQLADLGQKLMQGSQSGDYTPAVQAAIQSGDVPTALKLITLNQANKPDPAFNSMIGLPPQTGNSGVTPAPVGGFDNAFNRTLGFEGTTLATDNNGAPVKYGINQAANPDVNVANLNQDQAKAIYKARYWDPLGLDNVDPRLAHAVFDTAVNAGQGKAQELMDASGGDVNRFLALRSQFQNGLAQSNPDKYGPYAGAWNNRIAALRVDVNAPGGGIQVAANNTPSAAGSGAVASDEDANTAKIAALQGKQKMLLAGIARYTSTDPGKAKALSDALTITNADLKRIQDQADKGFTTMTPEEFKAAYPGQEYPANAIVGKDANGKPAVIHLSNERVPSDYQRSLERAKILRDQGIDPNSSQGREFIMTGKTDTATQMKATEQKTFDTESSKVLTLSQSIADLQKAKELNPLVYSGNVQPNAAAFVHRNVPGGDYLVDPKRVTATTQFENLVIGANASLGKDLFGARVTNYDEQLLQKLRANPQMAPDERAAIIDQMIAHRQETLQQSQSKLTEMKAGTRYQRQSPGAQPQQPQSQPQQAPSVAEGATATGPGGRKIILRGGQWVPLQ